MKKRLLSFFLSLAMVLSLFPTTAFAAEERAASNSCTASLTITATNVDVYFYYGNDLSALSQVTVNPVTQTQTDSNGTVTSTTKTYTYSNTNFRPNGNSGYLYIFYVPQDGYLLNTASSIGAYGTLPLSSITDTTVQNIGKNLNAQGFASYSRTGNYYDAIGGGSNGNMTVSASKVNLTVEATSSATGETPVGKGDTIDFTVEITPSTAVTSAKVKSLSITSLTIGGVSYPATLTGPDASGTYTAAIQGYVVTEADAKTNLAALQVEAAVTYENTFTDKTGSITATASVSAKTTTEVSLTDKFTVSATGGSQVSDVMVSAPLVYENGISVVTWAIPDPNYELDQVTVSGTAVQSQRENTLTLTGIQSNITVSITAKPKTYQIEYVLGAEDAANDESNPNTYSYGTGVSSFASPSRTNYTFLGWYSDEQFTTEVTSISNTHSGTVTLYAKWVEATAKKPDATPNPSNTQNLVTVTCDNTRMEDHGSATYGLLAGGYQVTSDILGNDVVGYTCTVTVDYAKYEEAFTADKAGNHAEVSKPTSNVLTLTYDPAIGKWTLATPVQIHMTCTNTVTFDSNYEGGTKRTETVPTGSTVEKPQETENPTRDNYVFAGWYTDEDCTDETEYDFDSEVTEDTTLYASWDEDNWNFIDNATGGDGDGIPDKYQVVVHFTSTGGGSVGGDTTQVFTLMNGNAYATSGSITVLESSVTKTAHEGYAFDCWTKNNGTEQVDPFAAQQVTGGTTITYVARWNPLDTITLTPQSIAAYVGGTSQNGSHIPELRYEVTSSVDLSTLTFTLHTVKDGTDTAQTMGVTSPEDCDYYLFPELDFDLGTVAENSTAVLRSNYLKLVDQNVDSTTHSGIYELALRTVANDSWDSWYITATDGENVYLVNLDVSNTQIAIREVADEDNAVNAPHLMLSTVSVQGDTLSAAANVATAVVTETTTFATNGKDSLGLLGTDSENAAQIALIFDDTISPVSHVSAADLEKMMLMLAEEHSGDDYSQWNTQFKYLDLVNHSDGNAIVTASEDVTIYWPYPDGITYETAEDYDFQLLHYQGFSRKNATELDLGKIESVENVAVTATEYGLMFTTQTFSSFVLMWKDAEVEVPPALNTENHYAYIIGKPDGNVYPEATITRAEVATIFFRLLTDESREAYLTTENNYTDVHEGQWFNTAVSTLTAMGILKGTGDTTFDPNRAITRAELAAICARFDKGEAVSTNVFSDLSGHWAEREILRAADLGWVLGYTDGTFRPNQDITRAETVTMINRVLGRVPQSKDDLCADMTVWPDNMNEGQWYYLAIQEATNSHDYTHASKEVWVALTETPDWKQYETK